MNVSVIGSGTMGSGIAQVAATAGCVVKLFDLNQDALSKSKNVLEVSLSKLVEKGKIDSSEKSRIQSNISYVSSIQDLSDSDLVIEAIVENLEVKRKVFSELEELVSKNSILASNTSSLSIASIAASCKNPDRVIGIHFFNPAPLMQLVEVIPAVQTSNEVVEKVVQIISDWKKVVAVAKDTPGFIVNRVARSYYSESIRIYEEGIADFATIDWALKTIGGFRMGPFELMDFIGHDVNYRVTEIVWSQFFYDNKFKPSIAQKRLFEANRFGRKSGIGFYDYREGAATLSPNKDQVLGEYIFTRIISLLINEAIDALYFKIASKDDIELAMLKGVNYPKGLLHWAEELGFGGILENLEELSFEYGDDRYRPSVLLKQMVRENRRFFN